MSVVVAANDSDYDKWVKGLTYLVDDTARSSYSVMVLRYFIVYCICRHFGTRTSQLRD